MQTSSPSSRFLGFTLGSCLDLVLSSSIIETTPANLSCSAGAFSAYATQTPPHRYSAETRWHDPLASAGNPADI